MQHAIVVVVGHIEIVARVNCDGDGSAQSGRADRRIAGTAVAAVVGGEIIARRTLAENLSTRIFFVSATKSSPLESKARPWGRHIPTALGVGALPPSSQAMELKSL